ncbi:MAG: hypothetical protein IKR10_04895, partial [Firmicutes bacterium]|nr:hypothetical protein [Bacillota bacterium]
RLSAEVYTGDMAAGASIKGFAALYDESGRFIGLTTANGAATESGETGLEFSFSEVDKAAASVKVMVTDEALTPAGQSLGSDEE